MKKCLLLGITVSLLLMGCSTNTEKETNHTESKPIFSAKTLDVIEAKKMFALENYYITNKVTGLNRYFIDDNSILWGQGNNVYGQLGNGKTADLGIAIDEPIKIAENVVSVDCSVNGYFCIYLTTDGELYGMGSNMLGLLGQKFDMTITYSVENYAKVTRPVLLMDNVSYARAGREAIVALKEDGSVWWWGQYNSTYKTNSSSVNDAWEPTENDQNTAKMLYNSPHKILDNCIYVTTGDWMGAAINENGDLYTWGLNIFGECGTTVTDDDYVRTPCKVLTDVQMVWPEEVKLNSIETKIPEQIDYSTTYNLNTFVQLKNGTILASGYGIGNKEKTIAVTGDLPAETTSFYSDTFIPVELKTYSADEIKNLVNQFETGDSRSNIETILTDNGIRYSYRLISDENGEYTVSPSDLIIGDQKYFLRFDSEDKLIGIY